jgi:hypothetical protein
MKISKILPGFAAVAFVFAGVVSPVSAATMVVHPLDPQGWGFVQETPTGSGQFVNGPAVPPMGTGSAELTVDSTGGVILANPAYGGMALSQISTLEYSTYRVSGGDALAPALQFNVDTNQFDANVAWQGRLVYEPYHTQAVLTGAWQTWDTLDDAAGTGTGNWWFTGAPGNTVCPQANPCTWTEVLTAFPNAGVHAVFGAVLFKAGGGWSTGFIGNVDAFILNEDVYDFELDVVVPPVFPMSKDECKEGGWMTFGDMFKNQGQCVSYVATGKNVV